MVHATQNESRRGDRDYKRKGGGVNEGNYFGARSFAFRSAVGVRIAARVRLGIERWTLPRGRPTFAAVRGKTTAAPEAFLGLPHRPPFVFVREVITTDPGVAVECRTTFDADDPMFIGHFPGNPLVPGVIITEALAQAAGIAAASGYTEAEPPLFLLSAIRGMKFLRPVLPGEEIRLHAAKLAQVGELLQFAVEASVSGAVVAEGQLVLSIASDTGSHLPPLT